nr:MAG TPA: hypothetical protein [Caudoviricetes sp.]
MSDWPNSPLIRITSGSLRGTVPLNGALAASAGLAASGTAFKYRVIQGPGTGRLIREDDPDSGSILSWEEVVPVPADDLRRLHGEFRGVSLSESQLSALLQITSCLDPGAASPLDQAVSAVEEALRGSMTSPDTSSEEYLAILLRALSNFQELELGPSSPEKMRSLSEIVRICVEWVAEISSTDRSGTGWGALEALDEARRRVKSDPAIGGFPAMAALAGDAASWVDEARDIEEDRQRLGSWLPEPVLTLAHYALALLAECLGSVSEMDVRAGHLPDPYRLDVAYAGGQPVGTVEKIVMDEPNPDRPGPYIRNALREGFTAELREAGDGSYEVTEC